MFPQSLRMNEHVFRAHHLRLIKDWMNGNDVPVRRNFWLLCLLSFVQTCSSLLCLLFIFPTSGQPFSLKFVNNLQKEQKQTIMKLEMQAMSAACGLRVCTCLLEHFSVCQFCCFSLSLWNLSNDDERRGSTGFGVSSFRFWKEAKRKIVKKIINQIKRSFCCCFHSNCSADGNKRRSTPLIYDYEPSSPRDLVLLALFPHILSFSTETSGQIAQDFSGTWWTCRVNQLRQSVVIWATSSARNSSKWKVS